MNATQNIKIYTSINKLPLSKFIDVMVDGDLTALVISGTPSEEELKAAWEDILQLYHDAIGGTKHSINIRLYSEIYRLQIKLQQINIAMGVLKRYYVKEFATALNKLLNSSFKFDASKPEEYDSNLQKCETRSKGIAMQISMKAKNLQAFNKGEIEVDQERPTRSYYQGLLISLSDHAGMVLTEDMSVFTFCERLRRYIKHIEHSVRQNHK